MAQEPDGPAHPYQALTERPQNSDKEAEIELYYKLLSSGHSVGEILNGVDPVRSNAEQRTATIAEPPRFGAEAVAADAAHAVAPTEAAPASASGASGPAGAYSSEDGEAAFHVGDRERPWFGSFPGIAKSVAFWALCTGAIASASVAGFAILHRDRGAEPAITRVQPTVSGVGGTEAAAMPGSEAMAEPLNPGKQAASSDASQASEPSIPVEPESAVPGAVPGPSQPVSAGVPQAVPAPRREAEAPPQPTSGQPNTIEELIGQLTNPTAAPRGPAPAPPTVAVQFPPVTPTGSAETAPQSDIGQSDIGQSDIGQSDTGQSEAGEKRQTAPKDAAKAVPAAPETGPAKSASAAPPSRAQAAKSRQASAGRQSAESRRHVSRRTAARHAQPVYRGQEPGLSYTDQRASSYYADPARGYGYGTYGPAPYSDSGN